MKKWKERLKSRVAVLLAVGGITWLIRRLIGSDLFAPTTPARLLDTRSGDDADAEPEVIDLNASPTPPPPSAEPPTEEEYLPPWPDEPESVEPVLGDSPGAHGVGPS